MRNEKNTNKKNTLAAAAARIFFAAQAILPAVKR